MNIHYNLDLKKKLCTDIYVNGKSTIKISNEYSVSLKTLEIIIVLIPKLLLKTILKFLILSLCQSWILCLPTSKKSIS